MKNESQKSKETFSKKKYKIPVSVSFSLRMLKES